MKTLWRKTEITFKILAVCFIIYFIGMTFK